MKNILNHMKKPILRLKILENKGMCMKKKLTLGLVLCVLLMNTLSVFSFAVDHLKPIIGIVAEEEIQELIAGEKGIFTIKVKNISNTVAYSIRATISGEHPFRSDVTNLNKIIPYLDSNRTQDIMFDVVVNPVAESKIYEFTVTLDYLNVDETAFKETQKVFVKVQNNRVEPIVAISGSKSGLAEVKDGQSTSMVVNLNNTGTVEAKDVRVSVSGFASEGVVLDGDASTKIVEKIDSKATELVYFKVKAGQEMKTTTFPVTVTVNYKDEYGKAYERTGIVYLSLKGKVDKDYNLSMKVENLKFNKSVKVKEDFNVTFDVVNTSKEDAVNAEVDLAYATEFISKTGSKTFIKGLKPGERKTITYTLMAKSGTITESYHNYINVKFVPTEKVDASPVQIQEYVGVFVNGDEADSKGSKPKLIIDNYNYGGEVVYAGEEYTLDLFIKNTSTVEGTKNIKVTLTSDEGVFTPIASSNSFFIKNIGPGEVHQHSVQLKTKIDASVKIYAMTVKMEYEDSKGKAYDENKTPYSESEALSIAVSQPVRLETADMTVPFDAMVGNPFYIEQEFYNMSKATMYNTMVKFEAEGLQASQSNYFIGNFDAGRSEFFSTQVTAMEPGTYEGKLLYTFEDALGKVTSIEKPFTVNISEMVMPEVDGNSEFPPVDGGLPVEKPFPWKWVIGGGVGAAFVVLIIIMKIRKKRRLKREMEALDE